MTSPSALRLLALLGVVSGWAVASEAGHDFAAWEPEIAAFERQDRTNPPPRDAVLFVGSSTIRLWTTLARDFPDQRVINRGFGGSQMVDAIHFAGRIIVPYHPRQIVLRAGGNDLWAGKSPDQVFAEFKEFVATVRMVLPDVEILFLSLFPSIARWKQAEQEQSLNRLIETYARQTPGLKYIDAWSVPLGPGGHPQPDLLVADQLHLSAAGYQRLAERVRPYLSPAPPR